MSSSVFNRTHIWSGSQTVLQLRLLWVTHGAFALSIRISVVKQWQMCFIHTHCRWRILTCEPSSSPLISSAQGCKSACWLFTRVQHWKEIFPCRTAQSCHDESHKNCGEKLRSIPQKWLFCYLWLWICLANVGRTSITPRWGFFYGEIKENQGGYLQLRWHSRPEDGVDCSPLIEGTLERRIAARQMGFHWPGNPGARGTSSGRGPHRKHACLKMQESSFKTHLGCGSDSGVYLYRSALFVWFVCFFLNWACEQKKGDRSSAKIFQRKEWDTSILILSAA